MDSKGRKRTTLRASCLVVLLIITLMCICACGSGGKQEAFKSNWKMELPEKMEEEYHVSDQGGFHNDGISYTVWKLTEEPSKFVADFLNEKDADFEQNVNKKLTEQATFDVPDNFMPDWDAGYHWKYFGKTPVRESEPLRYGDNLYMIYFPDAQRLIVCQSFT